MRLVWRVAHSWRWSLRVEMSDPCDPCLCAPPQVLNLKETFFGWGVGIRDHLMLEYACLLRSDANMWKLASRWDP